jgi:Tape measure protein
MPTLIGDIVFGFGADLSRLRNQQRDILNFGAVVDNVASTTVTGSAKIESAFLRQEAAITRAFNQMQKFHKEMRESATSAADPSAIIRKSQDAFKELTSQVAQPVPLAPLQMQRAMEQWTAAMQRNKLEFKDWKAAADEAAKSAVGFTGFLGQMATAASLVTGPLGGVAFRLALLSRLFEEGKLTAALWVGGAVLLAQGLSEIGKASVAAEMQLQRMKLQLEALGGGAIATALDMRFVVDIANQFGRPFNDVAQHFARLELASKNTRIEGEAMRDMFKEMIAFAAKFGMEEQRLDAILEVVTRSITRQRLEEQQFRTVQNLIPRARQIAAQAMTGGDQAAFDVLLQHGEIMTDTFWRKFWQGMMKEYGIDPTKRVENIFTATGRLANAQLALNNAFNQATGITDQYSSTLEKLASVCLLVAENMGMILKVSLTAGTAILGGLLSAMVVARVQALAAGFMQIVGAIAAVGTVGLAALAPVLPMLLVIGGTVAAAVAGWMLWNKAINDSKENVLGSVPPLREYIEQIDKGNEKLSTRIRLLIELAEKDLAAAQAALGAASAEAERLGTAPPSRKAGAEAAKTFFDAFVDEVGRLGPEGAGALTTAMVDTTEDAASKAVDAMMKARTRVAQLQADIARGLKLLADAREEEGKQTGVDSAETQFQIRRKTALREFEELVDQTRRTTAAMKEGPLALSGVMEQIQIEKKIEEWVRKFEQLRIEGKLSAEMIETLRQALQALADVKVPPLEERFKKATTEIKALTDENNRLATATKAGVEELGRVTEQIQIEKKVREWQQRFKELGVQVKDSQPIIDEYRKSLDALFDVKDSQKIVRFRIALRELGDSIKETSRTITAMAKSPRELDVVLEQIQIEKTVEQWRKKFEELGDSTEAASKKVRPLEEVLQRLAVMKRFDKEFMSMGQTIQFAFGELGKNAIDKFTEALVKGQLSALKFKDLVTTALEAILKKMMELVVLAPIMNALFGRGTMQQFSFTSGGTGTGGIIGGLLSMFGVGGGSAGGFGQVNAAGAPMPFAAPHGGSDAPMFKFANPAVFMGAPRLHNGLMPDEYPAILQRGERISPKGSMGDRGGNNVMIKIITPPDTKTETRRDTQSGIDMHEIIISHMQKGISSGRLDPSLAGRYGTRPRATLR